MPGSRTRDALLEQGALLFARHGATRVTARQLHEAVGARNESALHYHFGGLDGLVGEIVRLHVEAVEARRTPLVAMLEAEGPPVTCGRSSTPWPPRWPPTWPPRSAGPIYGSWPSSAIRPWPTRPRSG